MSTPGATPPRLSCRLGGSDAAVVVEPYTRTRHKQTGLLTVPVMVLPGRYTGRRGRPWLLTEDTHKRIVDALRAGVPVTHAYRAAGVSEDAAQRWIKRGREAAARLENAEEGADPQIDEDDEWCIRFYEDTTRARSEGAIRDVLLIQKAATGGYVTRRTEKKYRDPETGKVITEITEDHAGPDWRAAAKVLDSSYGWSAEAQQRVGVELSGPGGGPVQLAGEVQIAAVAARVAENIRVLSQRADRELVAGDDEGSGDAGEHA